MASKMNLVRDQMKDILDKRRELDKNERKKRRKQRRQTRALKRKRNLI
jgi:hypothetical protein